jgi:hypothetical protein
MAGVWKVFVLGPLERVRKFFLPFSDTFLPVWSLWLVGAARPLRRTHRGRFSKTSD